MLRAAQMAAYRPGAGGARTPAGVPLPPGALACHPPAAASPTLGACASSSARAAAGSTRGNPIT